MTENEEVLKVKIFGTEYPLRVQSGADYVREVANYVDRKMREVFETKPERTPYQIAILAALNITDELMQEKEGNDRVYRDLAQRIKKLSDSLEIGIKRVSEEFLE